MTEKTTLEIIAPTVEEAIAQGLAQLGLTADAVSVEVLDAGNKGFFGLGKPQVRVRLTVNPAGGAMDLPTESAPLPPHEAERAKPRPESSPSRALSTSVDRTQDKPAPAIASPAKKEKEAEAQPEHDAL